MEFLPQFLACPLTLWESFPGCPVGYVHPLPNSATSNPSLHTCESSPALIKFKVTWAIPPATDRKIIPFLLVTISKLESTTFQDLREKGPQTSETHQKGSFPEQETFHRYSLYKHAVPGPKWWQRQPWPCPQGSRSPMDEADLKNNKPVSQLCLSSQGQTSLKKQIVEISWRKEWKRWVILP